MVCLAEYHQIFFNIVGIVLVNVMYMQSIANLTDDTSVGTFVQYFLS